MEVMEVMNECVASGSMGAEGSSGMGEYETVQKSKRVKRDKERSRK
jgi:hypothetical protein